MLIWWMMKTIFNIANITFWEIIRDKILYGLIFLSVILLVVSTAMAQLSFAEQTKITMDFSLFVLNIATVIISIFLGAQLLYREVENKTLLTLLTHPVGRHQFLMGKVLGIFLIILLLSCIFTFLLLLQAWYYEYENYHLLFYPMVGILLESLIILSLTICLSTVFRVSISVSVSLFVYLLGHSIDNIKFFAEKVEGHFLDYVYKFASVLVPNFELMNWKGIVTTQVGIEPLYFFKVVIYSLVWFFIYVIISYVCFSKKDIT